MPPHPHLTCKRVATAPLSPSPSSTNAASIVRTDTQMVTYLTRYSFRATLSREISPPARRCPDLEPFPPPASPSPSCLSRKERSEEHTSELQSHSDLVCRLLLEKKNN